MSRPKFKAGDIVFQIEDKDWLKRIAAVNEDTYDVINMGFRNKPYLETLRVFSHHFLDRSFELDILFNTPLYKALNEKN